MIRWRVDRQLEQREWTAYRFAEEAGLTLSLAYRLARPEPVQRIDAETLERLCEFFSVPPGELLEWVPERKRGRGA
jgi:DNA-binding Xre family transcriptional regulator